jgi:hypothetical protein
MKKLKFDKKIEKYCCHCIHGKLLEYTDEVFCTKKGFVSKFDSCFKYKYDPLKRRPDAFSAVSEFTAEDFKLDV